jgi:DNA-binding LacI/PurR family transcriptional regulator
LLDLNHTRIAYLGDLENNFSAQEFASIEKALAKRGLSYPDEYRLSIPHNAEGASLGISRMMMLPPEKRPTAYLTFDDEMAIHVLNLLHYYGQRIPEDVSVVGFDNIPMAAHTYPPLTTIDVPKRRVGRQMVLLIEKLIENEVEGSLGHTIVDASLVVRGSTGPCPSS